MFKKYSVILTDLDGTLINSEPLIATCYTNALISNGYEVTQAQVAAISKGRHYKDFLKELCNIDDLILFERIRNLKNELYTQMLHHIELNTPLFNLLHHLKSFNQMGLVTSAGSDIVFPILKILELESFFNLVVTGSDVKNKKPNPECYLKCIQYFNKPAHEFLAFEDSESGIAAAQQADIEFIKINM
jgi:beta-phosphoglucomutase